MIVNGKNYDLNTLANNLDTTSNSYIKVGNLMLTKREVDILDKNHIDYRNASSLNDLRIKIESSIEDTSLDDDYTYDLEYVLDNIAERDYYANDKH